MGGVGGNEMVQMNIVNHPSDNEGWANFMHITKHNYNSSTGGGDHGLS